jgi:hypothetical protein
MRSKASQALVQQELFARLSVIKLLFRCEMMTMSYLSCRHPLPKEISIDATCWIMVGNSSMITMAVLRRKFQWMKTFHHQHLGRHSLHFGRRTTASLLFQVLRRIFAMNASSMRINTSMQQQTNQQQMRIYLKQPKMKTTNVKPNAC